MASRARLLFATSLVALPCLAYTCPCFGHNGRDVGPADEADNARSEERISTQGVLLDIYDGIAISVDPKTGIRSYTQVGDITPNPARARSAVLAQAGSGPGVDYWVEKSFERNPGGGYAPSHMIAPTASMSVYDEGHSDYYGYGGYYGGYLGYGRGGGGHRPGHGGGRPGHGDGDGGSAGGGCCRGTWSPPPGPPGGGVGSPPPYDFPGVGSPTPVPRFDSFRLRRG